MTEELAAAVDAAITPHTCPMDADPRLNMCPHAACWLVRPETCQAAERKSA